MKSRTERSMAREQKEMEGVNMPASLKSTRGWLAGVTAAALFGLIALPGVGHAENIEICIGAGGKIKGINLGIDECNPGQTELDWVSIGPQGPQGPTGVAGNPGIAGAQGIPGASGISGPAGPQGAPGPQGPQGLEGPTGPTGPAGVMGENGLRGPTGATGVTGVMGPSGTPGVAEGNISVFTGGSLGTLGADNGVNLSGNNSVGLPGTILELGPGNGSDTSQAVQVPMTTAGTAERLFVNVDADPGTQMNNGIPSVFFFYLCDGQFTSPPGANCTITCAIVGPDTTCSDTTDTQTFAVGDVMALWAFADYPGANAADVKWSVTYDHGALITPPM